MRNRSLDIFSTVKTEGAMLPPEILVRIAEMDGEMGGLTPDAYHLDKGEKINEAISRSWNRLLGVWGAFRKAQEVLPQGDPGTSLTREKWLLKLFDELGYGRLLPSKSLDVEGKIYPISHFWQHTPIHLIGFRADLDKSLTHHTGAYRYKPHSMVQEFLNRTEVHLWAFLSNGLQLRILRDNTSLVRQAYVEFDLEAMMDGGIFPDFKLLWLLCHQSRVEADRPGDCWLENWTRVTQVVGTRAREDLRKGVQRAIEALGAGFLSHSANERLREDLRAGHLDKQDYYRELLRFVYQLIFLFVGEDRDLLAPPSTMPDAKNRYIRYYSTIRLRVLAGRKVGTRHDDLYRVTRLIIDSLGEGEGRLELGIPILNSSLFSASSTPSIKKSLIANVDYLEAIRALAITSDRHGRRPTDYRNLGSEELGSVYESLLEMHPEVNIEAKTFTLMATPGNERKTTGSYYTPSSLISCLLDSALDPILDTASGKENPEQVILGLMVCDPACGSGHFLIAAAHRMAGRLASIRAGEEEPPPNMYRRALRDIIGRCIYGADINPMAVELCKVSLWMEALEPGKPLSFLDHHIRVGNSLLGATPDLIAAGLPDDAFSAIEGDDKKACAVLKKRNKAERMGLGPLFAQQEAEMQVRLQQAAAALSELPDDRLEDIRAKEFAFRRHEQTQEYLHKKRLADAWCAAFVIKKHFRETGREGSANGITQGHLNSLAEGRTLPADLDVEIDHLARRYKFFHWHLAFPEVFAKGGFDCVLGNPPWQAMSPDRSQFFGRYIPQFRAQSESEQEAAIAEVLRDEATAIIWAEYQRSLYASVLFMKSSGRYTRFAEGNLGKGDFNVYRMFVEHALDTGRTAAQVVPGAFATGANTSGIRRDLLVTSRLSTLIVFNNIQRQWFDVSVNSICVYVACPRCKDEVFSAVFQISSLEDLAKLRENTICFRHQEVMEQSPDLFAVPSVRNQFDANLTAKLYRAAPRFGVEEDGYPHRDLLRELDMGNDRDRFSDQNDGFPVYEGRMIDRYDYRAKQYVSGRGASSRWQGVPHDSPEKVIRSQWHVARNDIPSKLGDRWTRYRIGYGNIADPSMQRSVIAAIVPPQALCGDTVPTISAPVGSEWVFLSWLAVMNSMTFDFLARKQLASKHLTMTLLDSLPMPRLSPASNDFVRLGERVVALMCTGPEMDNYRVLLRQQLPLHARGSAETAALLNGAQRALANAGIDALVAKYLFRLDRSEYEFVLGSFDVLMRNEQKTYGEFRTKRLCIDAYDALEQQRT